MLSVLVDVSGHDSDGFFRQHEESGQFCRSSPRREEEGGAESSHLQQRVAGLERKEISLFSVTDKSNIITARDQIIANII